MSRFFVLLRLQMPRALMQLVSWSTWTRLNSLLWRQISHCLDMWVVPALHMLCFLRSSLETFSRKKIITEYVINSSSYWNFLDAVFFKLHFIKILILWGFWSINSLGYNLRPYLSLTGNLSKWLKLIILCLLGSSGNWWPIYTWLSIFQPYSVSTISVIRIAWYPCSDNLKRGCRKAISVSVSENSVWGGSNYARMLKPKLVK